MIVNLLDEKSRADAQEVAHTWDLIDWSPLGNILAQSVHFESARKHLLAPVRAQTVPQMEEQFDLLERALSLLPALESIYAQDVASLPAEEGRYQFLRLLAKSHVPDFYQLNLLSLLVESWDALEPYQLAPSVPAMPELKRHLCRPWRVFVKRDGEVMVDRHPQLGPIYRQLAQMEQNLRQMIGQLARQEPYAKALQMPQHDIMHDRYVLPVRADAYSSSMGAIIDRSTTGHTLYVEPFEMRALSGQRLELLAKADEIKYRICLEYVPLLMKHAESFAQCLTQLESLDELRARAQFCARFRLQRPQVAKEVVIELQDFYHPLVQNSVLNSISILPEHLGVILSGPNTGGKTVALKAICLSLMFMHRGLFVPARHARLFPFQGIFFVGHDQQNLSAGLSSFAAEATNYLQLLGQLQPYNAIFIDEIFNSTSSDEASALAKALFQEIHQHSRSLIFVSTHHQFLKTSMHQQRDYLSGHVGIDLETRRPTYKLFWGTPGSSHALTIFERLAQELKRGAGIVPEATRHLHAGHRLYETLLEELGQEKVRLERERQSIRTLKQQLENQEKASAGVLKLKRQELVQECLEKLDQVEKRARELMQEVGQGQVTRTAVGKRFAQLRADVLQASPESKEMDTLPPSAPDGKWRKVEWEEIVVGQKLHSLLHAKSVEVLGLNNRKREVLARVNNLRLSLPLKDLVVSSDRPIPAVQTNQVTVHLPDLDDVSTALDGRGMRLEEFQALVERAFAGLLQGSIPFVEIIHGHGDGILKNWLRLELKSLPAFKWRIPEGNDGATIVEKAGR